MIPIEPPGRIKRVPIRGCHLSCGFVEFHSAKARAHCGHAKRLDLLLLMIVMRLDRQQRGPRQDMKEPRTK